MKKKDLETNVLLLDCDGPCACFDLTICKAVNPNLTIDDLRKLNDWDCFKLFNEEEMKTCLKILEDPQFWADLPVNEPAQKAVEAFRKTDIKVVFLTAPWTGCKEWDSVRRNWLKKHFEVDGRKDVIITSGKELVIGDVFIDDKLENIQNWDKQWGRFGKTSLLFETNTNFMSDWYPRIQVVNDKWAISMKGEINE